MKDVLGRQQRRFHLKLPVTILTRNGNGNGTGGSKKEKAASAESLGGREQTFTHDISSKGCYLRLSRGVSIGSEIEIEIGIPALEGIPGGGKLHCRATVVRVEGEDVRGRVGVGCKFQRYKFSNPSDVLGLSHALRGHLNRAMEKVSRAPRDFAEQAVAATMLEIVG